VYLRNVADVRLGYREREAITRIDGMEAVEIAIYKEGDANTVAVARALEQRLKRVREILPPGFRLVEVYNQSTFIQQAIDEVVTAGVIGGLLAVLVLYFFLRDFASTLIISLSIPVSIIATFNLMYGFDLTLNIMSLGGLALGIGLLVDNSIVVLENVARHRSMGKDRTMAAREGAGEVGRAVVASTLTTIAVFFPLVFVKGVAGQLFRDQALTVTFSLLASLLVAITLIPMLSSFGRSGAEDDPPPQLKEPRTRIGRILRRIRLILFGTVPSFGARMVYRLGRWIGIGTRVALSPFVWAFNRLYESLASRYPAAIEWSLQRKGTVLGIALAMFAASILLIPTLGVELIPQLSQGSYDVEFRLPPGTPLERTDGVLNAVQRVAKTDPAIRLTFASAGSGSRMDANPDEGGENWAQLHVALEEGSDEMEENATMAALRSELSRMPGLQYKFARPTLFTFDTPVEIEISGYDLDALKTVSGHIAKRLEEIDRFADVKSSMEVGHPEIQIQFDRDRAAALGLAVHDVAQTVVNKVRGDVATRYSWHDRKIDVLVRAQESDRASVERLERLIVNPESTRPVTLSAVAKVVVDVGPSEIRRVGQERVAVVTANLRYGDLGAAAEQIEGIIDETIIPAGLGVRLAGQSEEMAVSFRSLLFALALAIFLVYLVMASQFESLVHPFVIFFTMPLALIGAVLALWLTGSTISVIVFIGVILLAGIVVNNAIILVDLVNQLRAEGMLKHAALVEAGRLRLRPILMTTLTTVLGLLPMALGLGEGAELRAPMAVTVIGGLVVSTLLTLVVIPVMYSVVDRRP
jgi:HAE1 family hydrophobic/amphiphilic exporter-1